MTILFLESRVSFERLLDIKKIENSQIKLEFDGIKKIVVNFDDLSKYSAIVFLDWTNLICHKIAVEALSRKIPSIFVMDGIYDWANTFFNKKHISQDLYPLSPFPYDYCFYVSLGDFYKYHSLINKRTKFVQYLPSRNRITRMNDDDDLTYDFLITTANTAYFNDDEFDSLAKLLLKVKDSISELGYTLAYRIYDEKLSSILLDQGDYKHNLIDGDFDAVVSAVGSVITTTSTICVTTALLDKPIISLVYRNIPSFSCAGWICSSDINIKNLLVEIKNKNSRDYKERLKFQRANLPKDQVDIISELSRIDNLFFNEIKKSNKFYIILKHIINRIKMKYFI